MKRETGRQGRKVRNASMVCVMRCASSGLHGGEALLQVGDDVVDVLGADGEADGVLVDALVLQLGLAQLGVGGGGGVVCF